MYTYNKYGILLYMHTVFIFIYIYILYIPYVAMKLCTPIKRRTMKEFLKVQPDNTRYKHKYTHQHTHTLTTTTRTRS